MTGLKIPMIERRAQLSEILVTEFGISLSSLVESDIQRLLNALPEVIDRSQPDIVQTILDACCIGETMFMRHPEHFELLVQNLLQYLTQNDRPLRIWSAGCCTGEEAYSLKATLFESGIAIDEVIASDLNPKFLNRARRGRYSSWSLRVIKPKQAQRWLKIDPSSVSVQNWLRHKIKFRRINLVAIPDMGTFDAIFCRNVLMYFGAEQAQKVYLELAKRCFPNGLLFIGYFDPAPQTPLWQEHHHDGIRFYTRAANTPIHKTPEPSPSAQVFKQAPKSPPAKISRRDNTPPPIAKHTPSPETPDLQTMLDDIRRIASKGEAKIAMDLVQDLMTSHPLEIEPCILGALIADEADDSRRCVEFSRRACFLAPESAMAQYLQALAFMRVGKTELAQKHTQLAQNCLKHIEDLSQPIDHAQGLTGEQLRRLLDDH